MAKPGEADGKENGMETLDAFERSTGICGIGNNNRVK